MKRNLRRAVSWLCVLAMCLSLLPSMAWATGTTTPTPAETQAANQIEGGASGTKYYTYNEDSEEFESNADTSATVTNRTDDPNVTISKEIEATGTENQFDITLTVTTDEAIETSTAQPDAAIVLVIDVSYSMGYCANCGGEKKNVSTGKIQHKQWCDKRDQTRMEAAQAAAKEFLASYAGFDGDGTYTDPNAARYVSIVTFAGSADTKHFGNWSNQFTWLDLHGESEEETLQNLETVGDVIDNLKLASSTNTDAGLKQAEKQLRNQTVSDIGNKFLLLLTDGEPNSNTGDQLRKNSGYVLPEDYPEDEDGWDGVEYQSDEDYANPAKRAMYIRTKLDTEFYSISFAAGNNVSKWMDSFSDECVTADNSEQLNIAFDDIIFRLLLAVDAWKVTDPMGQYMNYSMGASEEARHAAGAVSYDTATRTLTWNLRADLAGDSTKITNANDTEIDLSYYEQHPNETYTITYQLTYRVTLDVAAMVEDDETFTDGASGYLLTNGATKLDYYLTKTEGNETIYVDDEGTHIQSGKNPMLTMYFKVPKVRGYVGNLEFTKIGSDTGEPLPGATFSLSNIGWYATPVTTGADGKVSFTNIPSGAQYTLTETAAPSGYNKVTDIEITVAYGEVSYREGAFGGSGSDLTLTDPAKTGTLTVTKTVEGLEDGDTLPENFAITVTKSGEANSAATLEISDATTSSSDGATTYTWTISTLAPGTYTVTESGYEVAGYSVDATKTATATVIAGQSVSVQLANTYTKQVPGLTVEKTAEEESVNVGEDIHYTVTVENTGDVDLTNVVVTDTLWGYGTVLDVDAPDGVVYSYDGGTGLTIESLPEDAKVTITYTYKTDLSDAGNLKNSVSVTTDETPAPGTDETETTVGGSEVTISKELTDVNDQTYNNGKVRPGDVLTYTITVTNNGDGTVEDFTVTDSLWGSGVNQIQIGAADVDVTGGSYRFTGELYAGVTWSCTYDYTVPEDAESVENTAVLDLPGEDDPKATVTVDVEPYMPGIEITKTASVDGKPLGPGDLVEVGDVITYTITVTNTGETTFYNATVRDDMWGEGKVETIRVDNVNFDLVVENGYWTAVQPDGPYGTVDKLAPGETWTCTYVYTVPEGNDKISNTAAVEAGGAEDETTTTTNVQTEVPSEPIGGITVVYFVEHYLEQEDGSYQLDETERKTVTLEKPGITAYVTATPKVYPGYVWNSDEPGTVQYGEVKVPKDLEDLADIVYLRLYYDLVPLPEDSDIVVDKWSDDKDVRVGDTVEWTITVENTSKDFVYKNMSLLDMLNNNQELTVGEGKYIVYDGDSEAAPEEDEIPETPSGDPSDIPEDDETDDVSEISDEDTEDSVDRTAIGENISLGLTDPSVDFLLPEENAEDQPVDPYDFTLYPGEKVTFTVSYEVREGDVQLVNRITVKDSGGESIGEDIADSIDVIHPVVDLEVTKTRTSAGTASVGDTITWDIKITNHGDKDADDVTITDTLPGVVLSSTVVDVPAGHTVTVTAYYVVQENDSGTLLNTVVVRSPDDPDGDRDTDEGTEIIDPAEPDISVRKDVSDRYAEVGDVIEYAVTVRNTGGTRLDDVTVHDSLWAEGDRVYVEINGNTYWDTVDRHGEITIDSLLKDETVVITYEYTVTRADEGEVLVNHVIVTAGTDGGDTVRDEDSTETDIDDDYRPRPPRPADDDDEEEVPEEDLSGLNTTDHYAYIAGYTDGTVRPDGNITRAEVATIFFRLMTDEYRELYWSTSNSFSDVTAGSWYNNAISTTANAGWVSGYPDGSFRPDAYITRAEFATIAARFLSDVYGGADMFTDISGHWAANYINRAAAAGWINGYADGTFRPDAYITRAEAVTLINRMLDRAPDAGHLLADMIRWPDNPETAWYYADIQEATNSHDYTLSGNGDFEVWTELLANRDWAALEEIWSQANDAPGGEVMG